MSSEFSSPRILFRDDCLVVVDKPPGMLVHRSREAPDRGGFLLQWVRDEVGHFVYPVHRLDRNTSGLVIFALSSEMAARIQANLSLDETVKAYTTLVRGRSLPEFSSRRPLTDRGSGEKKKATSHFHRLKVIGGFSLLAVTIKTGRRHQIRRHLHHLGHQVVGDTTYGKGRINRWLRADFGLPRLFLHARFLRFEHPICPSKVEIHSPLPPDLAGFLRRFEESFPAEDTLLAGEGEFLERLPFGGDISTESQEAGAPQTGLP